LAVVTWFRRQELVQHLEVIRRSVRRELYRTAEAHISVSRTVGVKTPCYKPERRGFETR
jgi:hypothetical protein